eukprot:15328270-Heterocapsa_arctica.AAC.1
MQPRVREAGGAPIPMEIYQDDALMAMLAHSLRGAARRPPMPGTLGPGMAGGRRRRLHLEM